MKRIGKKSLIILFAILFLAVSTSASASATVVKEEVVYANLGNDGSVTEIYVVNAFDLEQDSQIIDYGNYNEVRNLTSTDSIVQNGDEIRLSAPTGRFYYQGNLASKEIPWNISIDYYLDGKQYDAEELAGKQGKLEIRLSLSPKQEADEVFLENYMLQATVTLDTKLCEHIVSKGATVANAGGNKVLSYMVMPGKEAEYLISADVTDFSMQGIQISGIPLSLNLEIPDTSSFSGQIGDLQTAIALIDGGASGLSEGLDTLSGGAGSLSSGISRLTAGAQELKRQSSGLVSGSSGILEGLGELEKALSQSDFSQIQSLVTNLSALAQNLKVISDGLTTANGSLLQCISALEQALAQLPEEDSAVLQAIDSLKDSTDPDVQTLIGGYQKQAKAIGAVKTAYSAYQVAHDNVEKLIEQLNKLSLGLSSLSAELENTDLEEMLGDLPGLTQAITEFKDNYQIFHNGLKEYTGGVDRLAVGLNELSEPMRELADGIKSAASGASDLSSGTGQLRSETSDMDTKIDDQIDDVLKDYVSDDFIPKSFVSEKNANISSVQFVFQTEGISKQEETVKTLSPSEQESLWDRFLNLFR